MFMEELFNLTYKKEVEALKEQENYEALGDKKFIHHKDMEARLYWAFCRPSGSHEDQLKDPHPLVSIMAFNHSRLPVLKRFSLVHKEVIEDPTLRIKISKRSRMLFRDLVDNDFRELNLVLELVPVFKDLAIDQLINGRKWNDDIYADETEATKFIQKSGNLANEQFFEALFLKLPDFEDFDLAQMKGFLEKILFKKEQIDTIILEHYKEKTSQWLEDQEIHTLQKKSIENLAKKLV
jgi:hypothetical protein